MSLGTILLKCLGFGLLLCETSQTPLNQMPSVWIAVLARLIVKVHYAPRKGWTASMEDALYFQKKKRLRAASSHAARPGIPTTRIGAVLCDVIEWSFDSLMQSY